MADTGWDMMTLQSNIVARYYRDVAGADNSTSPGQYTFPCESEMPDLKLIIGGKVKTLLGRVVRYHPLGDGSGSTYQFFSTLLFWEVEEVRFDW